MRTYEDMVPHVSIYGISFHNEYFKSLRGKNATSLCCQCSDSVQTFISHTRAYWELDKRGGAGHRQRGAHPHYVLKFNNSRFQ